MPKKRDRECSRCFIILKNTASRAEICLACQKIVKKENDTKIEMNLLTSWGYELIAGPQYDKFNHRTYIINTPCCFNNYEVVFNNLRKQISNAKAKSLDVPCGFCGPKKRFSKALEKYIEKYGINYDLEVMKDYRRKVRGLSEVTYKNNKHIINPLNLPRGLTEGYHLDHIIPIIECFKRGWTPEEAAEISNLQMLTAEDNLTKGSSLLFI